MCSSDLYQKFSFHTSPTADALYPFPSPPTPLFPLVSTTLFPESVCLFLFDLVWFVHLFFLIFHIGVKSEGICLCRIKSKETVPAVPCSRNAYMCSPNDTDTDVHSNAIHSSQLEITQMLIHSRINNCSGVTQ